MKELLKGFRAPVSHMLPLTLLVLAADLLLRLFTEDAMPAGMLNRFIIGAVLLLAGMSLIELGAEMSMIPMGERVGAYLTKTGRYSLLIICCLLMGILVTAAEPDIAVLAAQYPGIADMHIIYAIALGVGVFLTLGVLRVIKNVHLPLTLTLFYALVFILAEIAPQKLYAFAFDAGGVATGPILTPFIMSVGMGLAFVRGGRRSRDDSFGMVALCGLGPVIAMLIYGLFVSRGEAYIAPAVTVHLEQNESALEFLHALPEYMREVAFALLPITLFFALFHLIFLRTKEKQLARIGFGLVYSFVGHTLFLTGVTCGFLPAAEHLGFAVASLEGGLHWAIVPLGMLMGYFVVMAEPAVRVLNRSVEELTVGAVSQRAMMTMLSLGAAVSVCIAMIRIITGIPLNFFLIAGYAVSLILSFIVPGMFTAIAFDSGGVATGALSLVFLMPFAKGASLALGSTESLFTDAFGLMALMVVTPIITIQLLGLSYTLKLRRAAYGAGGADSSVTIIEFETEDL